MNECSRADEREVRIFIHKWMKSSCSRIGEGDYGRESHSKSRADLIAPEPRSLPSPLDFRQLVRRGFGSGSIGYVPRSCEWVSVGGLLPLLSAKQTIEGDGEGRTF